MPATSQSGILTFNQLDFEQSYQLKLLKYERIVAGHTNLIYKLHLEDERIIIARISDSRTVEALEYEAMFHEFLTINNINCPKILGSGYVQMLQNYQTGIEYPSILMEYIEGSHPCEIIDLYFAGRELGKLHQLTGPSFSRKQSGLNLEKFKSLSFPREFEYYISSSLLEEIISTVEKGVSKSPKVICHGDFFRINTLLSNNEVYIFDFESMGEDIALLDLGKAMFGMVTPRTTCIDSQLVLAFLKGYCENQQLSQDQINLLPLISSMAGIQVAYWRYHFWLNNPNHYDIKENLWRDALRTSLAWHNFTI